MKIAVLTGNLPNYDTLALYTIRLNKAPYCVRHGYDLELVSETRPKFRDPNSHAGGFSWSRLEHLAEMLESGKWDWVWTVGCDTLITNLTLTLESIIQEAETIRAINTPMPKCPDLGLPFVLPGILKWRPASNQIPIGKKHLLICGERVTALQADSFIVRSSPEGVSYVRDILECYPIYRHHGWVENQAMIDLREKHAAITHIVPQWRMNSYDYARFYGLHPVYRDGTDCYGNRGQWQLGDFLIHWPCSSLEERFEFLAYYWPKIVNA